MTGRRLAQRHRALRLSLIGALLVVGSVCAAAQNNSLLRRNLTANGRSTPAPTSQPTAVEPSSPAAGVGVRPMPAGGINPAAEPPPNPMLVMFSPIGVAPPKPKKIGVHDLVTIIVRESRTSLNDAKSKSVKDWEIKSELAKWIRLDKNDHLVPQKFEKSGAPGVDFTWEDKYEGKGKYDRKDELTTRVTATVLDVKPNGNLVLEARKRIKIGDEILIATLTGECRAEDVTPQNTVLSTQIANLEIEMPDEGAVRDATRRGWLKRLLDWTRPF